MSGPAPELDCPYVGLAPFEAVHADYFFGRSLDSTVLADNVLARRITVLYGASGVGKSSVLNVGLPKALAELGVAARIVARREWHEPGVLGAWLDGAIGAARSAPAQPLIAILDQFEEYFLYPDAEQIKGFAKSLAALVARTDIEAHLLFALRDDGLHRLDALRVYLPGLLDTTLELRHLDEGAVREAIEKPIAEWNEHHRPGVVLDSDFAGALIAQLRPKDKNSQPVEGSRVELAYLQLALERIWEAEGGAEAKALRTSTLTERLKGISEISRRHVEEVLDKLPEADQALCATVFDRLVTPSGGKILYATPDLAVVAKVAPTRIDSVLAPLASGKNRLLRAVELPAGRHARGYEILHDILAWPILDWVETKVERDRADAEARARQQAESDRARLAKMRNWLLGLAAMLLCALGFAAWAALKANHQTVIAKEQAEEATKAKADAVEQRKRAEAQSVKAKKALDIATDAQERTEKALESAQAEKTQRANAEKALGVATDAQKKTEWAAERNYKEARSRELATVAETKLERDPELGILLALEAKAASPTPHVEQILRRGLSEWTGWEIARIPSDVRSIAVSPSRQELVLVGADGKVSLWSYPDPGPGRELSLSRSAAATGLERPVSVAYEPKGQFIGLGWSDGLVQIWPVSGVAPIREWKAHAGEVVELCFTSDGRYVVSAAQDEKVKAWDRQGGSPLEMDMGEPQFVRVVCGPESAPDRVSVSVHDRENRRRSVVWGITSPAPKVVFEWSADDATLDTAGRLIVSGSAGLEMLDVETGGPVGRLDDVRGAWDLTVSADGRFLTGRNRDRAFMWSLMGSSFGHVVSVLRLSEHWRGFAFSPDAKYLLSAGDDGVVRAAPVGERITTQQLATEAILSSSPTDPLPTAVSAGVAVLVSPDLRANLWDVREGYVRRFQLDAKEGGTKVDAISLDDEGKSLFARSVGRVRVWDTKSEGLVRTLESYVYSRTLVVDAKGRYLARGPNCDGWCLWSWKTGKPELNMYRGDQYPPEAVAVSPSGRYLLVGEQSVARIWDLDSGKAGEALQIPRMDMTSAAFSADPASRFLIVGKSDGRVAKWNVEHGFTVWEKALPDSFAVAVVAFSSNGKCAAVGRSYTGGALGVVLDADTGTKLEELWGHFGAITSIAFSDDSRSVLTVSQDGTAREFPMPICGSEEDLARLVTARVKRGLTVEERRRYLNK
jgi:WD40 repeat protein